MANLQPQRDTTAWYLKKGDMFLNGMTPFTVHEVLRDFDPSKKVKLRSGTTWLTLSAAKKLTIYA